MLIARRVVTALLVLLLTGCSTTFLYNRLDIILPWYMGTYVDLDRQQRDYLDELLDPFLTWHREEELARYLEIIDDLSRRLDRDVTAGDVVAISLQFEAAWFRLEKRGLDGLLALGDRLSDAQMAEFIESLWKKQRDYEEEYLSRSDEVYRDDSYEALKDSLQDYLGRLRPDQREVLRASSEALWRSDGVWLAEREVWIKRFEAILVDRQPDWQQQIRESVARRDESVSSDYVETYGHNLEVIHRAIAGVLSSRDEKQDRRLRRKLDDLREDVETLIARAR